MGTRQFDAVIAGAGFGGIDRAIQLKWLGCDNILIVDQPSTTYSYWFEPTPPGRACLRRARS
jgi:cation diffusion facilitator CzcD-associated flavoprotein CzcO